MTTDIIQADYGQLEAIAQRFAGQAEAVQQMQASLRSAMEPLQNGDWIGRGSAAFFAEMNQHTLPAVERLQAALAQANGVTLEISRIMQAAEEEAARPFRGEAEGGVPFGGNGQGVSAPGGSSGTPAIENLVVKSPQAIFNKSYMENFIGSSFKGANSAELNRLMEDLFRAGANNNPNVNRILDRIADIRGVDRAEFQAQYQTYLQLLERGEAIGGNGPDIDLNRHGNFLGSTVSLRYGAVVGDTFGIDPVFGSLLNPTGGLVGPGSDSYQPGPNDAVGYHGIFHDAAGYLYNYQGIGPGYDYMGREPFATSSPLTGQVGGISWWMSHSQLEVDVVPNLMPDIPLVPRFVERGVGEALEGRLVSVARIGASTVEGGSQIVDGIGDVFGGNFSEGLSDMGSGAGTVLKGLGRSVIDFFD